MPLDTEEILVIEHLLSTGVLLQTNAGEAAAGACAQLAGACSRVMDRAL